MEREDNFTSTVDGAAAFERWHHGDDYEDDRPDLADVVDDSTLEPDFDNAWEVVPEYMEGDPF